MIPFLKKNKTTKNHVDNRTFDYKYGDPPTVNLSFTLRIGVKDELEPFLGLLKEAVIDVQEQIDLLKN